MEDSSSSYHREINEQCVCVEQATDLHLRIPRALCVLLLSLAAVWYPDLEIIWLLNAFLPSTLQNSFLLTFLYLVSKSFRIYPLTMHWLLSFIIQYLMRVCILLSRLVLRSRRFSTSIFLPGSFLALKKSLKSFFFK